MRVRVAERLREFGPHVKGTADALWNWLAWESDIEYGCDYSPPLPPASAMAADIAESIAYAEPPRATDPPCARDCRGCEVARAMRADRRALCK